MFEDKMEMAIRYLILIWKKLMLDWIMDKRGEMVRRKLGH
jgi:hypothetical protein